MLILSADQIATIKSHAEQTYPEECCGLLLGTLKSDSGVPNKVVKQLVALKNQWTPESVAAHEPATDGSAQSKRRRYWIDPKDMLRSQKQAREQGLSIIGIYHSHPDHVAAPSECDRALAWPEYAYVIVSVAGAIADSSAQTAAQTSGAKATDVQNWTLDSEHQFQPEPIRVIPSAAKDRMPVSA